MATEIITARTPEDISDVTRLAWDFVGFLNERYPERREDTLLYLKEQRFEEMLANLPQYFNPPHGECLLARLDGTGVGIVMLKKVNDDLCEMNRMYVDPKARGHGIGRQLCESLISEARSLGYRQIRLGALDRHVEALPLYRSVGFIPNPKPPHQKAGVIHLHMDL